MILVEQLSAVSPLTDTETEDDKAGEGVNTFVGDDCTDTPPT